MFSNVVQCCQMLRANGRKFPTSKDVDLKKREQHNNKRWEWWAACSSCQSSILGNPKFHHCPHACQRHDSISFPQFREGALAYFFCHPECHIVLNVLATWPRVDENVLEIPKLNFKNDKCLAKSHILGPLLTPPSATTTAKLAPRLRLRTRHNDPVMRSNIRKVSMDVQSNSGLEMYPTEGNF